MLVPCKTILLLAVCIILQAEAVTLTGWREATSTDDGGSTDAPTTVEEVHDDPVTSPTVHSVRHVPGMSRRDRQRLRVEKRRSNRAKNRRQREQQRRQQRGRRGNVVHAGVGQGGRQAGPPTVELSWVAANLSSLWQTLRRIETTVGDIVQENNLVLPEGASSMPADCRQEEVELEECLLDDTTCRESPLAETCSGKGACCCGDCHCTAPSYGRYCECDDESCDRYDGEVCGGNGSCVCGKCHCDEGYEGEACQCPTSPDACTDPQSGLQCNNVGLCQCGKCACENGNFGQYCEEMSYSAGLCEQLKPCVLCNALGKTMPQCTLCSHVSVQRVQNMVPSLKTCLMVHSGCLLQYSYQRLTDGRYDVMVPEDLAC